MDNERIIELETRLSFAEHSLTELSDEMARQAQQIARLEQINAKLIERLRELMESAAESGKGETPVDERPPHY